MSLSQARIFASLPELLKSVSSEPDPAEAITSLVRGCIRYTEASSGRLVRLNLGRSVYECVCQFGRSDPLSTISVSVLDEDIPASSLLEDVIVSRKPKVIPNATRVPRSVNLAPKSASIMLMPIVRGNECLGVLDFESESEGHFSHEMQSFAACVSPAFLLLFEKQRTLDLLRALQQPINFHQGFRAFLSDLILLIADASGMPYIALREFIREPEEMLDCLAQYGFDDAFEEDEHFLDLRSIPDSMRPVIEQGRSVVAPDASLVGLPKLSVTDAVKSFVATPVKVGDDIFGILSFGCSCKYEFTPLEVAGFESIANGIGVSIANYRNWQARHDDVLEKIRNNVVITAVEVAQAARHQARHHIDNAQMLLALLKGQAEKPTRENAQKMPSYIAKATQELGDISLSLDRIKNISKPPVREIQRCVLNELWRDAFDIVLGRLETEGIRFSVTGRKVSADVYPDFLRHAFLNLVLNSIDAFRDAKRHNRSIVVTIEDPGEASNQVRMTYTDNATGIDPSKLMPRVDDQVRSVDAIFEAGVTSKPDGSGYGLFLIRRILDEHKGSIDLKNYRAGVVFELTLPRVRSATGSN